MCVCMYVWMDVWMDGCIYVCTCVRLAMWFLDALSTCTNAFDRKRWTDRQTETEAEAETETETETQLQPQSQPRTQTPTYTYTHQARSTASISPSSQRTPCTLTCESLRPTNTSPSSVTFTTSPLL